MCTKQKARDFVERLERDRIITIANSSDRIQVELAVQDLLEQDRFDIELGIQVHSLESSVEMLKSQLRAKDTEIDNLEAKLKEKQR